MAWNEPGGSGGRDPWGGRNDQGPPDLDELMRKLQRKFGGMFGGRSGSGGNGDGAVGLGALILVAVSAVIAIIIWVFSGFYIVEEGKRGVELRLGAYAETSLPGLHWYPRFINTVSIVDFDRIRIVELGVRNEEALMLTQDENIIDIKFTVQYKVKDPKAYLFNVRDPDTTLRQATESAVREVVGKSKMDFIITGGRAEIAARAAELLQQILNSYDTGILVTSLNMQEAQAPDQVQDAFADAVKAREDEQRYINEAQAYSNDILPRARGQAARVLEEANAYKESVIAKAQGETSRFLAVLEEYHKAPEVTRRRIYLETMEQVLGNTNKVVVDSQGANNSVMYLPLDRMMEGHPAAAPSTQPSSSYYPPVTSSEPARPVEQPRGREDLRRRETR